ncbi:hypothetical protein SAMN05216196_102504 [Lutimaribacter pacificus]|uniref:Uncharacterized protein n=1 Tax=Lutimaribacter pacificus TaxID=391948 RepID=A0A1H0F7S1_9RHOB|nr:hypothetical protein [Lutimaribacter pacificus]SDN90645.1 hypothetical protein SAMN05216196_102504 [Lutimaribacter pacificus]SHK45910.1 hypothetical protein SAMN05444142_105218 [Lutimaribacter pacificus]
MTKAKRTLVLATRGRGNKPSTVTAPGREFAEKMLANGCSRETVAATLGLSSSALKTAADNDPLLAEAMARGDGALETELVGHLLQHAREGNVTAAIFLLKAKRGFRDSTPVEPKDAQPNITINLPGAASPEDYRRMIDVTPDPTQQRNKS